MTSTSARLDPAPARLSVGIVSAGRVGSALGVALERAGHVVFGVAANSPASRRRARNRLPDSQVLPIEKIAERSELLILAVPDTALDAVTGRLAAERSVRPGTIVLHTSGAHGVKVLQPLTELGVRAVAVHPAMTFTGHDDDLSRVTGACFGVTATDEVGYAIAQSLVIEMGGEPVRVAEEHRVLYHAALAHGSNHVVTVVSDAVAALRTALAEPALLARRAGADDSGDGVGARSAGGGEGVITQDQADIAVEYRIAERMLSPLVRAAVQGALDRGQAALTGPTARDDAAAVRAHLRALSEVDREIADSYRALSTRTAQCVGADAVRKVVDEP